MTVIMLLGITVLHGPCAMFGSGSAPGTQECFRTVGYVLFDYVMCVCGKQNDRTFNVALYSQLPYQLN